MYDQQPIIKLSEVDYARADTFGDRACSLSRLISRGYHVPKGVVVSTKMFKRYLNTTPGTKRIDQLINQVSPETIEETAREIQDLINFSPVPMQMANSIADAIMPLLDQSVTQNLVVRTSASVEGSSRHVYTGRGVNFHMNDVSQIIRVIKNCWASAYTADILKDLIEIGLPPDSVWVAVLIEEMVKAKISGVMTVENKENISNIYIQANWGTQVHHSEEGICCDHIIIDNSKQSIGEPIQIYNAYKDKIKHISEDTRQPTVIENDPEKKLQVSLDQEKISTLAQLARKIQEDFEVGYNIEFVFDENNTLWVLDAVPLSIYKNLSKIGSSDLSKTI
jgi:pyruvate,water dikinase